MTETMHRKISENLEITYRDASEYLTRNSAELSSGEIHDIVERAKYYWQTGTKPADDPEYWDHCALSELPSYILADLFRKSATDLDWTHFKSELYLANISHPNALNELQANLLGDILIKLVQDGVKSRTDVFQLAESIRNAAFADKSFDDVVKDMINDITVLNADQVRGLKRSEDAPGSARERFCSLYKQHTSQPPANTVLQVQVTVPEGLSADATLQSVLSQFGDSVLQMLADHGTVVVRISPRRRWPFTAKRALPKAVTLIVADNGSITATSSPP